MASVSTEDYCKFEQFMNSWRPWKKKFAYLPCIIDHKIVWFKTYYERSGMFMPAHRVQRVSTIFGVLKDA